MNSSLRCVIVHIADESPWQTTGRIAFVFRCRGPFVGTLKPTPRETFPGNIILISQRETSAFYLNGASISLGERQEIDGPARIEVGAEEVVFFLATFTKKV